MRLLSGAIATAAAMSLAVPPANAQSFSCMEIERLTPAEVRVCKTESLAHLDERLDSWYRRALERAGFFDQTEQVKAEQRAWIAKRNGCGRSIPCLRRAYVDRISALRAYVEHV